jgi:hypothetical protein
VLVGTAVGVLVGIAVGVRVGVGVGVRVGIGVGVRVGVDVGVCSTAALGGGAEVNTTAAGSGVEDGSPMASKLAAGGAGGSSVSVSPGSISAGGAEAGREGLGVAMTAGGCSSDAVISPSTPGIGMAASATSRPPVRKQQMCTVLVQRPSEA